MPTDLHAFSLALRKERRAKGLSAKQLESLSGVDRQRIYEYEQGVATNPTLETLSRLADALGCSLDALTGRQG